MGTTYQVPNLASYENHPVHDFSAYGTSCATRADRFDKLRPVVIEPTLHPLSHYASHRAHQKLAQLRSSTASSTTISQAVSQLTSQSSVSQQSTCRSTPSPISGFPTALQMDRGLSLRDSAMVLHSLVIPSCISPRGGDLADFAAQITALFWFESIKVLELAEKVQDLLPTTTIRPLNPAAIASSHFKKWVRSVLSTTQVTQNVILLALMFIYRLKVANPTVNGRPGSEYRLLTVALMLGNKFLDDNTYTNKTWAEVSAISVSEIHVMEVEFLSNMRYSLLASKEQWEEWLVKLAKFWEYLELAQMPPASPSPLVVPSPTYRGLSSPLPSPTGTASIPAGPGHVVANAQAVAQAGGIEQAYSPLPNVYASNTSDASWQGAYQSRSAISPTASRPEQQMLSRKRGFSEDDPVQVPPKRLNFGRSYQSNPVQQGPQLVPQIPLPQQALHHPQHTSSSNAVSMQARLSVPNLTVNTSRTIVPTEPYLVPIASSHGQSQPAGSLPLPGMRAMSTVYPSLGSTYASQIPVAMTAPSGIATLGPSTVTPTTAFPPATYGTPSRRLSPQSAASSTASYATSSQINELFAQHSHTSHGIKGAPSGAHTPVTHSPSIYLQQRPSPYKPVRHVNTLLHPPPSAFLQQYHLANAIPPSRMHYQPLGRRNEFRTGIVPEFAMASAGTYGAVLDAQHLAGAPTVAHPLRMLPNQGEAKLQQYAPGGPRTISSQHPSYN